MKTTTRNSFLTLLMLFFLGSSPLLAQNVYTFTPAGATGNTGPTQGMANTAYTGTTLDGQVTVIGGIQYWVVPTSGSYQIEAFGGQGYGNFGGRGAHITGEFLLTGGDTLKILPGQQAGPYLNFPATTYNHQFGGGGGSFVTTTSNTPLVVAGGGGGNHGNAYVTSCDGQIGTSGAAGANASTTGAGGTNGQGGQQATSADAGGGLLGNGNGTAGGQSFINGALGGIDEGTGGFGCGGGTSSWNNYRGGGGGGYSGGGGGNNGGTCCPAGGGGGSFNAGTSPVNLAGVQTGDGMVIITALTRYPNEVGVVDIKGFTPPVCTGTYPVTGVVKNFGNNQVNSVTVGWSIDGIFQGDTNVTALIDTSGGTGFDTLAVTVGNITLTTAATIRVWSNMPNGQTDSVSFNDTTEITIAPPAVVSTMVIADVSCNGGSDGEAMAMGAGGSPGYTYTWSTGDTTNTIANQPTGLYTAYLTDSLGCTDSAVVFIGQPTPLTSMVSVSNISCNGEADGQLIVNPMGGTPGYLTVWSPGGTTTFLDSLSVGTYSYTITDANGCVFTNSASITEPTAISLSTSVTDETNPGSNGAVDLTVAGGTAGYTFLWSNGATTEDITGLTGGTYTVNVTDANGCTSTTTVTVAGFVGNNALQSGISYKVYPNPSNGTFQVDVANATDDISIEVTDMIGKRIAFIQNANAVTQLNLKEKNGVYFVKISVGKRTATQRLIIAK